MNVANQKKFEFGHRPKIDQLEGAQNARATVALRLLKDVCENLNRSEFTSDEITEYFNPTIPMKSSPTWKIVRYGPKTLAWLVEQGYVAEAQDDSYFVTMKGECWYEAQYE